VSDTNNGSVLLLFFVDIYYDTDTSINLAKLFEIDVCLIMV